ncbi:MAG: gamma-glutamylcyclotransferase [Desulfovibrio sp.]|nr:gamma-glutamylcyclotransferase [Desulfovibrio sp.]
MPLFVYGTLQRGGRLHGYMRGFDFVGEASVPGRLLHCGGFPGLIAGEKGECVHGEIYRVKPGFDPEELLAGLDSVEGFSGFGRHNLYERRIITATDVAGKETPCWVYHWMGKMALPVVEGGCWEK